MANKENISLLSKYQMRVLYYKSKEGATHEEIAEILGRDVNTVQYHMSKIYKVLDITRPGKTREEMDSELKHEICPIIRQMFQSIDDVKIWAPSAARTNQDDEGEEEIPAPAGNEAAASPYQPPPSVEKVLRQAGSGSSPPRVTQPPPPGRTRFNLGRVISWVAVIVVVVIGLWVYPQVSAIFRKPAPAAEGPSPTQPAPLPEPTENPASLPAASGGATAARAILPTASPAPIQVVTRVSPVDGMVQVSVPAGEFKMGSARMDDPQTLDEEVPQHTVYLDAYWIDQTEVTNARYALCVADNGTCTRPGSTASLSRSDYYENPLYAGFPVIHVNWNQAAAYCAWAGRRLPSEAEWEKAARGPEGRIFPWGQALDGSLANYCDINCTNGWKDTNFDDGYVDTAPAGDYPAGASVYGVLDMAGNVYEWVADWYGPYSRTMQENPVGPASGLEHIIRGGSWGDDSAHIRAATRSHINIPDYATDFIGFRCAE